MRERVRKQRPEPLPLKMTEIGQQCTEIINRPEEKLDQLGNLLPLLESAADGSADTILLAVAKVFKNVAPLYRIRAHSDKVKHRNGELPTSPFDTRLLHHYNAYMRHLCASTTPTSYKAACVLLSSLDHFNFSDRLISKVLLGSNHNSPAVSGLCCDTLVDRVKEDSTGETVFMIVNQCLDYRHSHRIVGALLESDYLGKCLTTRIEREEKYDKKDKKALAREKESIARKGYFARAKVYDQKARKDEKQLVLQRRRTQQSEEDSLKPIDDKNYVRTVNALQRLYFTILKGKLTDCFSATFRGLRKYSRLIRKEFREGLLVLLNESLASEPAATDEHTADAHDAVRGHLECVKTIVHFYLEAGVDMKKPINTLYRWAHLFMAAEHCEDFCGIVKQLFIDEKQTGARALALAQRLMQCSCMRYQPRVIGLIRMIEARYDLDYSDGETRGGTRASPDASGDDIDRVEHRPLYEYFLYKRMV